MKKVEHKFVETRRVFYTISIILIIAAIVSLFGKGLNYGIDFKGGNIIHVTFNNVTNDNAIREVFKGIQGLYFSADQITIQNVASGEDKEFIIQYPAATRDNIETNKVQDEILKKLKASIEYSDDSLEVSSIGPTVGDEMKKQGIIAAFLSCIGILLYLSYRFDFVSASGVVIAVVHDLIVTLGFISIVGFEFDTTILAAILTLLGTSVNDSIVIFDRIRENSRISKIGTKYEVIVNNSINQSLDRTYNTTLTTLIALLALAFLGGDSIKGFAIALTFGSIIGTYSSICIAPTCVLDIFKNTPHKSGDKVFELTVK